MVAQFDDASTSTVTENQFAPVRISSRRALLVEGVASGTVIPVSDNGTTLSIDDNSSTISIDDGGSTISIDDAASSLTVDNNGTFAVQLSTALPTGTNSIGTLGSNPGVNIGEVTISSLSPGSGTASLGKVHDGAFTSGDLGVMSLAVRTDTPANRGTVDGRYEPLQI